MKTILPPILIMLSFTLLAFKNPSIYNAKTEYKFDAFFIKDNDTITVEEFIVKPKRLKWLLITSQKRCKYIYSMDSLNYVKIINPLERNQYFVEQVKAKKESKGEQFYGLWAKKKRQVMC